MRPTPRAALSALLTFALALGACGGADDGGGGAAGDGLESAGVEAAGVEAAGSQAGGAGSGGAGTASSWDPAALCDALDTEAIATLAGGEVETTNSTDRSMMESVSGHCQVMMSENRTVDIQVWADAEDRFLSRPGSDRTPLMESDRVRPIEGVGERAAAIWATADFENPSNNIRGVAVDYGGVAVNVSARNLELIREPDLFVAIADRVRADLGL